MDRKYQVTETETGARTAAVQNVRQYGRGSCEPRARKERETTALRHAVRSAKNKILVLASKMKCCECHPRAADVKDAGLLIPEWRKGTLVHPRHEPNPT
jgi:hypothetical protein